jgi:peptide/nickel transport system permease protein
MAAYVIRRLLYMIPTVILISIIAFLVIQAPPGDFLTSYINELQETAGTLSVMEIDFLRAQYGLDKPIHAQYLSWITNIILRGDFGYSLAQQRPVREILAERVPLTMMITAFTLVFTWVVAIPLGVLSAVKQYSLFDYVFTFLAFIGRSIPAFLLALMLMFAFYTLFGWSLGGLYSPEYQYAPWSIGKLIDLSKHLVLPVVVIGSAGTALLVRVLRGMVLDELGKQYVRTARSKGLPERAVVWKHIFRIAILPLISTIGWLLPQLVSGSLIVSIVLNLPTTGSAMFNALMDQDMYLSGSFVLILSILTVIGTLISDILLALIDPRIRYD